MKAVTGLAMAADCPISRSRAMGPAHQAVRSRGARRKLSAYAQTGAHHHPADRRDGVKTAKRRGAQVAQRPGRDHAGAFNASMPRSRAIASGGGGVHRRQATPRCRDRRRKGRSAPAGRQGSCSRPCAPMGGTTCAASAIRAVRGPVKRSAIWLMIGHSVSRVACVRWPSTPAERTFSAVSKSSRAGPSGGRSRAALHPDHRGRGLAVPVGQRHQ